MRYSLIVLLTATLGVACLYGCFDICAKYKVGGQPQVTGTVTLPATVTIGTGTQPASAPASVPAPGR